MMDAPLRGRRTDKAIAPSEASVSRASPSNQAVFLQTVRQSNEAVSNGDFRRAVQLYTDAIELDPSNHILFTNRSAAYLKLGQCQKSVEDARRAKELNPKWVKAYLREGVALQHLSQHGDALAAFASGLAQDPNNAPLLSGLVDAALCSPLKEKLQATFIQLERLRLNRSPFVIISVIGQELLGAGHFSASVQMLESALKIGTCSLKLRGSVFSALSSAYWGLGNIDKAIHHMQQDLTVAKALGDQDGECRAYGNLGSAYFSKGNYKEALTYNRYQLILSMKSKDRETAASALSSLGHVYTAIGDYPNALNSHKQCVLLRKQSGDKLAEAREIGNVGAVYLAMGNFDNAVECHQEHLKIAKKANNPVEEARAFSNLGSAYHYKREYDRAMMFHKQVLKIAEQKSDKTLEARAYAGLGHAARCAGDNLGAKVFHEKQLDNALQTRDRVAEARACANLGIIFHQLEEYDAALKLHKTNLRIATFLGDKASQGRAYGNIGNAYSSLGQYEDAVKYHNKELTIASEVNDHHSKGSTHGNVAVAYQALGMYEHALQNYLAHLNIARELKDTASEARALFNLGNFHCARREYSSAISFYEQNLILCQELHDVEGESKACFNLGYVHYSVENYAEAVRYYEQDLALARERKDRLALARAYCNLGLAHKSLKNFSESLECQKKCLGLMDALKNTPGKFRALGNIGDIMLKTGTPEEAIAIYQQQLQLAKQCKNQDLIATAYGALGIAHRVMEQYDKALGFHTQELNIRQEISDLKGECRAHGNIGNVHMSLANYMNAYKCYEEQLERSRELHDSALEAQACGNLGITKMNMGQHEEAIGLFEQQLAMLEQLYGSVTMKDKGKAFGNLGDCYEALGDYEEAVKCHEQFLTLAQQSGSLSEQDRAYRGLGNAHRAIGNLQQALVCFEKRLVVAHELNSSAAKASAYGELGCLHSLLGNFEQAISCLEHQLSIAQEMEDQQCEGDAACGLGGVYQQMGEYEMALKYHQMDLQIAETTDSTACQCRAYGNLGLSHESLGNYEDAVKYQEQHLSIAAQMNDRVAKTLAYSSLGRVHHALGHHTQAVQYLQQGLQIAEQLGRREDEAKIRHRLGLSLWGAGNLTECQHQLYKAADLFEMIRRETQCSNDYKLSLFDLQTACYQALQRVLVALNQQEEALVVAERACTRAFIDLLLERQAGSAGLFNGTTMDLSPITIEQITSTVRQRNAFVLSFSIAAGYLYSWLLGPQDGVIKFHSISLSELETDHEHSDTVSMLSFSNTSILDHCIGQVRETIGVETHMTGSSASNRSLKRARLSGNLSESDGESDDVFQLQLEELGDRLNAENDRTGFLRMVNRGHAFNSSTYSLNSLFSLGGSSLGGPGGSVRKGSVRAGGATTSGGKSPLSVLYQYLIGPMEETLKTMTDNQENVDNPGPVDLVLVLQGDLFLIPFMMLKEKQDQEYLFERFNLIIVPSINAIQNSQKTDKHGRPVIGSSGALVVGNPKLTSSICQHWHLSDINGAEFEAGIVGEILSCRPLIGAEATKGAVLHQIEQVEVIHFAAHISWKLSSIVLSPSESVTSSGHFSAIDSDDAASDISSFDGPALSEYLLTAADILNLKLNAKLVVLNSAYTADRAGRVNTDGVIGLTRSLLSAGAQCVLFSLWPVPDQATKMLMRTMYLSLEEGQCVTRALSKAIKTVQSTHQFSHPSNWGGWVLIGSDIKLSSKLAQMGHAICEILQSPTQCREAMRVLLHLIEKSLQRIHQGTKNSMYTTYQSIENKVGGVSGWKDLLQAVGFRFEPSASGLPPAVFFPMTDPADRLTQASNSLQALLGLPPISVTALSKFITNFDVGEALIVVMRVILSKLTAKETGIDVLVNVRLWRAPGCHEFLASLGLDLVDVGQDNVTLRLSKQAVRRHLQFALQALAAVFDAMEAPRSHALNTSSSMESLSSSSQSSSMSTSTFSSLPPQSPRGKKSLFNPAEMEKIKHTRGHLLNKCGPSRSSPSTRCQQVDPAVQLSLQSAIRSRYPPSAEPRLFQFDSLNTTGDTSDTPSSSPCFTDTPDTPSPVSHNRLGTGLFTNDRDNRYHNGKAVSLRPCVSNSRTDAEKLEKVGVSDIKTRKMFEQVRHDQTNGRMSSPNDSDKTDDSSSTSRRSAESAEYLSRRSADSVECLEGQSKFSSTSETSMSKTSEIRKQFENMTRLSGQYVPVKKSSSVRDDTSRHSSGSSGSRLVADDDLSVSSYPVLNKNWQLKERKQMDSDQITVNGFEKTDQNCSRQKSKNKSFDDESSTNGPQWTHEDGSEVRKVITNDSFVNGQQQFESHGPSMMSPEELAKKVMADVPNVREVVEQMQHMSLVQSQQNSMHIRQAGVERSDSQQESLKQCASHSEVTLPNTLYSSRNQVMMSSSPSHMSDSTPAGEGTNMEYISGCQSYRKVTPPSRSSSLSHSETSYTDFSSTGQWNRKISTPSSSSITHTDLDSAGQSYQKITPPSRDRSSSLSESSYPDFSTGGQSRRKVTPPSKGGSVSHGDMTHLDHSSTAESYRKVTPPSNKQFSNEGPVKNEMIVNSVSQSSVHGPTKSDIANSATNSSNGQSCENSISSDNSEGADSNLQSSVSSGYHSERTFNNDIVTNSSKADKDVYTQDFVNRTPANAYSSSALSFSSFRPYQPAAPLVKTNALSRPDSTTSTSSQYSTSSSNRSVIYRPIQEEQESDVTTNHVPCWNMKPSSSSSVADPGRLRPSKHVAVKKNKKKVSFSDSDAGDSSNTSFDTNSREASPQNYSFDSAINSTPGTDGSLEYHSLGRSYGHKQASFQQNHSSQSSHPITSIEHYPGFLHRADASSEGSVGNSLPMKQFYFDKDKKNATKSHVLQSSKC